MTNNIDNAPEVNASAEALRYVVKNLGLNKGALKQAVWDAADQLERMQGQFNEVINLARQMQEQNQELQGVITNQQELITSLQSENSRLVKAEEPVVLNEESELLRGYQPRHMMEGPESLSRVEHELNPEDEDFAEAMADQVREGEERVVLQPNAVNLECNCWNADAVEACPIHTDYPTEDLGSHGDGSGTWVDPEDEDD